MTRLLELRGLSKSFGALTVTDNFDLDVDEGEAIGIIGPNGAGKSTLFNLITGDLKPDGGSIHFLGRDITRTPPNARCHMGIGRSYQIPHPFANMTVFENLLVGASFGGAGRVRDPQAHSVAVLARSGLLDKANALAGSLTLLERKRLELARALATQPRLLLFDEIAGGLTEAEGHALVGTIRDIHRAGTTIIWIEHIVHVLVEVAQRLVVINFGRKLEDGEPRAVLATKEVQEVYLGMEEVA